MLITHDHDDDQQRDARRAFPLTDASPAGIGSESPISTQTSPHRSARVLGKSFALRFYRSGNLHGPSHTYTTRYPDGWWSAFGNLGCRQAAAGCVSKPSRCHGGQVRPRFGRCDASDGRTSFFGASEESHVERALQSRIPCWHFAFAHLYATSAPAGDWRLGAAPACARFAMEN